MCDAVQKLTASGTLVLRPWTLPQITTGAAPMITDELQDIVKHAELKVCQTNANIYEFPTGRQLDTDEINVLRDLERWEQVLSEW
jgi:hypothetical protein